VQPFATLNGRVLCKALRIKNFCTAGSVDQLPKHFWSRYLFGDGFSIPLPDVDRTRNPPVSGANPWCQTEVS
jgi:hypothetical protein